MRQDSRQMVSLHPDARMFSPVAPTDMLTPISRRPTDRSRHIMLCDFGLACVSTYYYEDRYFQLTFSLV